MTQALRSPGRFPKLESETKQPTRTAIGSKVHYLPLTPGLFSILFFLAFGLIILVQLRILKIGGLGAPVASIGGAGTFDGIFLTGILAVLLAGIASPSRPRPAW